MKKETERLFKDFLQAVTNLGEGLEKTVDDLDRDGAIKRFELSYELAWKFMKAYLAETGIICKNPRDCFKSAKSNGLIKDEMGWLNMIEDRNLLVHTYTMELSRQIFDRINMAHYALLVDFLAEVKKKDEN